MSGAPNTQGGISYDADGRVQEAQPGRKRGGMPGLAAARVGFFGGSGEVASPGGGFTPAGPAPVEQDSAESTHPRLGRRARRRAQREAEAAAAIGPDGQIDPEWASKNPEDAQAKLIEIQREDFNARYRPLEEAAIAEYMKSPEQAAQRAGGIAGQGFANAQGMSQRALGRQGASMTSDQLRASGASTGLAQARAVGTAENTTRRAITDRNIEGIGTMIGIGRGIQGSVNSGMDGAAGMQTARNQAHAGAKAAHKQNMIGTGVAVAGLAAAF